jgi:PAS domain S-box-containing protein
MRANEQKDGANNSGRKTKPKKEVFDSKAPVSVGPQEAAFECAPIGMAVFLADGTWLTYNQRLCDIFGYERDELAKLSVKDVTYPADFEADKAQFERLLAGEIERYEIEKRYIHKDERIIWGHLTVSAVKDEHGQPSFFVASVEETTTRQQEQSQLQQLAELVHLADDAIFIQEPGTNRIIFWSGGAERTYGWSAEEAVGRVASELLETKFPLPRDELLATLETNSRWSGDLIHTSKDGRRITVASRWVLQQERDPHIPSVILEVNRDITEQRALEAQRAAFAERHKHVAEALQHSLLMAPPPDIFPGITIKALYQGAHDDLLVGGDFFDIFAAGKNTIALVIGDVTGKGLEAAMYTAEVKFVLRGFLREYPSPAIALERLNKFICAKDQLDADHIGQSYVALAAVVVNTTSGDLSAALAGMEMPFLLRVNGETDQFSGGGPLLGVDSGAQYEGQKSILMAGDTLVMCTDGLIEARSPLQRLAFFGKEGVESAMKQAMAEHSSLADIGQEVLEQARRFAGGNIRDDVCLLLARSRSIS